MSARAIHTAGDLILVRAVDGAVRLYGVEDDGSLSEQPRAVAHAVLEAREARGEVSGD